MILKQLIQILDNAQNIKKPRFDKGDRKIPWKFCF